MFVKLESEILIKEVLQVRYQKYDVIHLTLPSYS